MSEKETYFSWAQRTIQPSALNAWNYQQKKIDYLEENMAKAICSGKDRLKMTIYELNEFVKENLKSIHNLETENKKLKEMLDVKEN